MVSAPKVLARTSLTSLSLGDAPTSSLWDQHGVGQTSPWTELCELCATFPEGREYHGSPESQESRALGTLSLK